jgi:hypothetical protein
VWSVDHLFIPVFTGVFVGLALRWAAIASEVGQHDLRGEQINTDLTRWVHDRGRALNGEIFHASNLARQGVIEDVAQTPVPAKLERFPPGDLTSSGAFVLRVERLMRQALHEYRDEASQKVREYRTMARSEGWLHRSRRWWRRETPPAPLKLSDGGFQELDRWRTREIGFWSRATATVEDDPTRTDDAGEIRSLEKNGLSWEEAGQRGSVGANN